MSSSEQQAAPSAPTRRLAQEVAAAEAAVALSRSRRQTAEAEAALTAKRTQLTLARACEDEAQQQLVLATLPADLVRLIFLLLPVDARLRCREVCRGWYAFLSEASLWRVCDLSARSGVVAERTPSLLHAASVMAQGTLTVLDVTAWRGLFNQVDEDEVEDDETLSRLTVLLPVLHANAGSLVELRAWDCFEPVNDYYLSVEDIEALLAAAPQLRLLECDAGAEGEEAATTLRLLEEPQFAPVRLRAVYLDEQGGFSLDVPAAAAKIALHTSLVRLELLCVALDTEPALDAVVNLAVSQLQHLTMACCRLSQASLPALMQMLVSGSLTELCIYDDAPLVVGSGAPAFCAALRASRLVELKLEGVRLWHSLEDGLAVVAACTGHPTLRKLNLQYNGLEGAPGRAEIEAALDALAASNTELRVLR